MMKKMVKAILYVGCMLGMIVPGCVAPPATFVATVIATTGVAQASQTSTIRPTQTSTPTPGATAVFTLTPTITVTDIPTLTFAEAGQMLDTMLAQNGGCNLPCWWGMHPGKTRWVDARAVLRSFVERIEEQTMTVDGADGVPHQVNLAYVYFARGNPSPQFSLETPGYFAVQSTDGIVNLVLAYQDTATRFDLPVLLTEYGQPSEVYINTTNDSPTGKVPFSLVLYYAETGILAFYHDNAAVVDDQIRFCGPANPPINLETWTPSLQTNQKVKEEFVAGLDYWIYDTGLQPIQNVTELTIEEFYMQFRAVQNTPCIVTPSDKWIITSPFYIPSLTPSPTLP